MKIKHYFLSTALLAFISCGETTTETTASETPATDTTTVATETEEPSVEPEVLSTPENTNITHGASGPFAIQAAFPGEGEYVGYELVKIEETRATEEGEETVVLYNCKFGDEIHMQIVPQWDNDALIGEIKVLSDDYKTSEDIGIGSTIDEFYLSYPEGSANYTYVSDMYWLDSPNLKGVQFLLHAEDYLEKVYVDGDLVSLDPSKFKEGAVIQGVRIF